MKRALVTGACGFVGAVLVRKLVSDGNEVHAIARPGSDTWRLRDLDQVKLHFLSLDDFDSLKACIAEVEPDWIFHLAAHGAYSWQNDMQQIIASNVTATANVLECAHQYGVKAVVTAGSSSEYGYKTAPAKESDWISPNSEYAVMKACATHLCGLYAATKGLRTATLRLYSIFGPYEDERRFIPTLIAHGLRGKLPPLVDPSVARDFVYVDDAVEAFLMTARALEGKDGQPEIPPGSVFNVGLGKQYTIEDVVTLVTELLEIKETPVWGSMQNRKWDTPSWVANNEKIQQELGWKPKFDLRQGLLETIKWSRERQLTKQS